MCFCDSNDTTGVGGEGERENEFVIPVFCKGFLFKIWKKFIKSTETKLNKT